MNVGNVPSNSKKDMRPKHRKLRAVLPEKKRIKEDALDLALLAYDLYKDTPTDDTVGNGQNNANKLKEN